MVLTKEEAKQLKEIVDNKYAVGPFSGMIFNAALKYPAMTIEQLIKQALNIQTMMDELSGGNTPSSPLSNDYDTLMAARENPNYKWWYKIAKKKGVQPNTIYPKKDILKSTEEYNDNLLKGIITNE